MTDAQDMILEQEGLRLTVYLDSNGIETIGVGRNIRDKGLSKEEAMILLNNDLCDAIADARHSFSCYDTLSRPRQLVLIGLAYNIGRTGLSQFVRFIGAVHRGDWEDAADELVDSKWYTQVGIRGKQYVRMMRENKSEWT